MHPVVFYPAVFLLVGGIGVVAAGNGGIGRSGGDRDRHFGAATRIDRRIKRIAAQRKGVGEVVGHPIVKHQPYEATGVVQVIVPIG